MQSSIKLSANTFKMGDINTDSPVRTKTTTPVNLCSLGKQVERKAKLQQLSCLKTEKGTLRVARGDIIQVNIIVCTMAKVSISEQRLRFVGSAHS